MYCDLNLIKILVFFQQERNDATAQAGRAALAAAGGAGAVAAIVVNGLPRPAVPQAPGQQQQQQWPRCNIL